MKNDKRRRESASHKGDVADSLERLPTGVPGLDVLLRGGIPRYAAVIIAGPPGTGKTILCQQMLFHNATAQRPSVYMTTLSESPIKVARYQSQFAYFDLNKFGTSVVYLDIGQIIRAEGLRKSLETIAKSLRDLQPGVVAIDSFKAIHDLAPSASEMRSFIYDVCIELAAMQTTSLLVGEYSPDDIALQPEFAIADGIIWLYGEAREGQLARYLRILKMRGTDYETSAQSFAITPDGVTIYAGERLTHIPAVLPKERLTRTGLRELDDLLHGGIPGGSPMLVSGGAGAGKTTLCLQYLHEGAATYNEKGIFFSLEEERGQLIANAAGFGWDLQRLIDAGKLRIFHTELPRINVSEQLLFIRQAVSEFGAQRAVVDSLTMLLSKVSDQGTLRQHVYDLASIFKRLGCTALITSDPPVGANAISRFGVEESIIDGVILLKMASEKRARLRYLEVFKLRGVYHATGDNMMKITPRGIEIFPRVEVVD